MWGSSGVSFRTNIIFYYILTICQTLKFRDSSLFRTFDKGENEIDLEEVGRNLTDVATWCKTNKLTINESKTKYNVI